ARLITATGLTAVQPGFEDVVASGITVDDDFPPAGGGALWMPEAPGLTSPLSVNFQHTCPAESVNVAVPDAAPAACTYDAVSLAVKPPAAAADPGRTRTTSRTARRARRRTRPKSDARASARQSGRTLNASSRQIPPGRTRSAPFRSVPAGACWKRRSAAPSAPCPPPVPGRASASR